MERQHYREDKGLQPLVYTVAGSSVWDQAN